MPGTVWVITLLLVVGCSLSTRLEPWFQNWAGSRTGSANILHITLGDSRRLFAKHFYVKADAYFHSGYYPSIYDTRPKQEKMHMAAAAGAGRGSGEEETDHLGHSRDWIDAFSRHFYPSQHSHLGEKKQAGCCDHDHDHDHDHAAGTTCDHEPKQGAEMGELLPWLKLSAALDPDQPETYIVTSYWLRTHLKKPEEAERFLRQGLQAIPGHPEILLELGRIYDENRDDAERARNVWQLGIKNWQKTEAQKPDANVFVYAQLLGHIAKLEEKQNNKSEALRYLRVLKTISPNKDAIARWIEELSK